jgi:citrate lyase beta subunit
VSYRQSLGSDTIERIFAPLAAANQSFARRYPLPAARRQPLHTVYGGAHLFKASSSKRLGELAERAFRAYADNPATLSGLFDLDAQLAENVHHLLSQKLKREAVEDFRIDFEDGYGHRSDEEEDGHAAFCASEMAAAWRRQELPPFSGVRIKGFSEELRFRAVRTLDIFVTTLLEETSGSLPDNFVVTLPKVTHPAQVHALSKLLSTIESQQGMSSRLLQMELMVETPQALIDAQGNVALASLVDAADGRCRGVHFGAYDYTSALEISANKQSIDHDTCRFARHIMQVALSGTGVWLSDGATNVLPIPPHRQARTSEELAENSQAVHNAWRLSFHHITASLQQGFYQGWDLHPHQIPVRYAANYAFFLSGLDTAAMRLRAFMEKAAQASLVQDMFDDAATGQGLLNFFLRALNCGAIGEDDLAATGLTRDELHTRSFFSILKGRRLQDRL